MDVLQRFMELSKEYPDTHDAFKRLYFEISCLDPMDFDKALSYFVDLYHSEKPSQPVIEESSSELNNFLAGFEVAQ